MTTEEEKLITITLDKYINLQQESWVLTMLENDGVDNWQWYYEGEDSIKEDIIESYNITPEEAEGLDLKELVEFGIKKQHSTKP